MGDGRRRVLARTPFSAGRMALEHCKTLLEARTVAGSVATAVLPCWRGCGCALPCCEGCALLSSAGRLRGGLQGLPRPAEAETGQALRTVPHMHVPC